MLSMNIAFSCFPMLFGSLYLLCHKLGTKGGEKKALKKTLLSQPFSGLVTLDKMAFKKNKIHFRGFFFFQKDRICYNNQDGTIPWQLVCPFTKNPNKVYIHFFIPFMFPPIEKMKDISGLCTNTAKGRCQPTNLLLLNLL
jgi:hypothetical protein